MFYNSDILSKRKGGLGTIWLAATIGGKNLNRKLSRRDLISVNLVEACRNISAPTEPMALRLSSQLLYGVVRIHMQQAELWMTDVAHVHTSIKKIILDIANSMGTGTSDIDLRSGGPASSLTLQSKGGGGIWLGDFDYDFTWDLLPGGAGGDQSQSGIDSAALASGSITSPRHTAAKQSITLAQPPAYDDEDIGVGREGAAEDPFGGMYLQDDPQPGLDLNLDEIDRPEGLDELFQDGGAMANLGPGRSSSQLGHDQFDFNDDNFQFPEDDPIPQFDADGNEIIPGFDVEMADAIPGAEVDKARSPSKRSSSSLDLIATSNKPSKKKKIAFSNVDPRTELSDDELRQARGNYVTEMARQRLQIEQKGAEKKSQEIARQLLFGPPLELSEAPVLIQFWDDSVGAHLRDLENVFAEKRKRAIRGSVTPALRDGSPGMGRMDLDAEIAAGLGRPTHGLEDLGADDMDMPQLDDFPLGDNAFGQGLGDGNDSFSTERGRAASVGNDTRLSQRSNLPWNVQAAQRQVEAGDETRASGSLEKSHSRSFSVVEPALGPRASDASSARRAGSVRGESISGMIDEGDQFPGFEDEAEDPSASQLPTESQVRNTELEQEAQNFLEYAKTVSSELPAGQQFMFSDLAPEADTIPGVAALAFYHVLALTSSRRMKVSQAEPYGYINLTV